MIIGSFYKINDRGIDNNLLLGDIRELKPEYFSNEIAKSSKLSVNLFLFIGEADFEYHGEDEDESVLVFYHPQHGKVWFYQYEEEYFELCGR